MLNNILTDEPDTNNLVNDFKVGIYVRSWNEKNIIEWMEYHYKCGFDFILFYDDYSEPSIQSIIDDYGKIDKTKYKILEKIFPKHGSTPHDFLNDPNAFITNIKPILEKEVDYCLYIDIDEYIYMDKFLTIKDLIKYYSPFDQLFICYKNFGWDNKISNDTNSLINVFKKSQPNTISCGKSLVKINSLLTTDNPHFFHLKNDSINKDQYNTVFKENWFTPSTEETRKISNIYIAHYYTQDINTFLNRRFFSKKNSTCCQLEWWRELASKGFCGNNKQWETFSTELTNDFENIKQKCIDHVLIYDINNTSNNTSNINNNLDNISKLFWNWNYTATIENDDLFNFYNK